MADIAPKSRSKSAEVSIAYRPSLDDYSKKTFEEVFGEKNIHFGEYINKGIVGASYDNYFIITFGAIGLNVLSNYIYDLGKKIFRWNESQSRPMYTIIVMRGSGHIVQLDNMNSENEIYISGPGGPPVRLRGLTSDQICRILIDLSVRSDQQTAGGN